MEGRKIQFGRIAGAGFAMLLMARLRSRRKGAAPDLS
jgi:hypothetical protein